MLFFPALLKTIETFKILLPECTNNIHFSVEQDTVEENRSRFTIPNRNNRHKNKKIKIIKTHIIGKSLINTFIATLRI